MNVTTKYLDKVMKKHKLENKNQLAVFLGESRHRIQNYYNRGTGFDLFMIFKIADLLGIDPDIIIIEISQEKAKDEKEREFWSKKAKLIALASIVLIIPITTLATAVDKGLNGHDKNFFNAKQSIYYAKLPKQKYNS